MNSETAAIQKGHTTQEQFGNFDIYHTFSKKMPTSKYMYTTEGWTEGQHVDRRTTDDQLQSLLLLHVSKKCVKSLSKPYKQLFKCKC